MAIFTPMASNCENLNYSVFLSPQQTKLDLIWAHTEWEECECYCLVLIAEQQILLRVTFKVFMENDVHISFEPWRTRWKVLSVLLWHSVRARGKCELFTPWRHFSDDTPVSEIVFCFIRDHFLPAVFAPLLIVLACDGQLRTRQESQHKYHLTPSINKELKESQCNLLCQSALFHLSGFMNRSHNSEHTLKDGRSLNYFVLFSWFIRSRVFETQSVFLFLIMRLTL